MRTLLFFVILAVNGAAQPYSQFLVLYETNNITRIGQSNFFTAELQNPQNGNEMRASAFLSLGVNFAGWPLPKCNYSGVRCNLVRDGLFWLTFAATPGLLVGTTVKARNWNVMVLLRLGSPKYRVMELVLPNDPALVGIRFYGQIIAFTPYATCGPTTYDRQPVRVSYIHQFDVRK